MRDTNLAGSSSTHYAKTQVPTLFLTQLPTNVHAGMWQALGPLTSIRETLLALTWLLQALTEWTST